MAEQEPRNAQPDDELSVEELEDVSGGLADNGNCGASCTNTNCTRACFPADPTEPSGPIYA